MAKGNKIVISANPDPARFRECIVSGTPKPGTVMQLKASTAFVGGRPTYEARSLTAGSKGANAVLLPNTLEGQLSTTAYADGARGFLYFPQAGDELNMLLEDVSGTADTVAIGDRFGVNNNGKLKRDSSYTSTPYQAIEALSALTADALVACVYNGDNA